MGKVIKWILRGGVLLVILLVIATAIGYVFLQKTLTRENGTAIVAGISGNVRVVRDKNAIPHIVGDTLIDVVAAQGYIHAQERLWQMETFRMAGQGRLSQMFGEKTIKSDKFLRGLNLANHSKASFTKLKPRSQKLLEAYARGVNAYITRETRMFEPALPVEFMILGHTPEPWQPWHSMLTTKIMALTLGANMGNEIKRLALASKGFNPNEIDDLVGYNSKDNPPKLPDLRQLYGFPPSGKTATNQYLPNDNNIEIAQSGFELPWSIGVTASNNWVVAGERTQSGKTLLANDPHLGLTAPAIWYLAHLSWKDDKGEQRNIIGASMPSIPLVLLGRNNKTAWGFTTSMLDSQDLYIERINPENENQYKTKDGWQNFQTRKETIKVTGKPDVVFDVRSTVHGPILPRKYRNLDRYLPQGHVAALKWIALSDTDTSFDTLFQLPLQSNVDGMINSVENMVSPMQTIVLGDVEGNIGMMAPARVAIRKPENDIMGRAPVPGWMPQYEWQGFLKIEQTPRFKNPTNNVLFSANSKFVDDTYKHHLTWDWAEEFRHDRVKELILDANLPHSVANMKHGQGDDYSPAMIQFRDAALRHIPAGVSIDQNIMSAMKSWDGHMERKAAMPLIMVAWFKHLYIAMLSDDLGEDYKLFDKGNMTVLLRILKFGGARDWCDDRNKKGAQTCAQIIQLSLKAAIAELKVSYGEDWKKWNWGKAHIAYGQHRPFAKVPPLDQLFNVEIESGGGPYTLLRGQMSLGKEKPYYNTHASSYRAIYDFADLDNSLYIHTTGQSGNFLSPFYSNMAQKWADVEYLKMSTKPGDYEKDAVGVWDIKGAE